jgi:ferredoxin-type protein NapF
MTGDARDGALLPPWAVRAEAFDRGCTRCGQCVDACPTHVLKLAGGVVRVDFDDAECTFCGACVETCPEPVFEVEARAAGARPWAAVARIGSTCLARLGIACESCGDACESHAIRFRVHAGTVPEPRVDSTHCTGCGACVRVCPATAIEVRKASG